MTYPLSRELQLLDRDKTRPQPPLLKLLDTLLVSDCNHLIQKELGMNLSHLADNGQELAKPDVGLFGSH